MDYILQSKEVSKNFSGRMAVDHVSIGVKKGDIYGFIGENGAGKTTFMRMVCGLAAPTSGEITLFGSKDLVSHRHKMGCTIETPGLFPEMTALENMETQRLLLGFKDKSVCAEILELAGIGKTGKMKVKNFSLGMKQRLMIALSLLGDPEFLVLDEPTNGLDPMGIKEVRDFLQRLNEAKGLTIFISSHILGELEKLATRYGIISSGKMIDEFRADELPTRCGKNLAIHTSDLQRTENIVRELFPDAQCTRASENSIRINGHIEESGRINKVLVESGITVNALIPEGENLEDYLLKLIGGKAYA
jgi:ABC-2 type transport system ATP-binding protein